MQSSELGMRNAELSLQNSSCGRTGRKHSRADCVFVSFTPHSAFRAPHFLSSRRGVSLLEVLFAVMIATIGLLGALAVFPVASTQARRGRTQDSIAVAGTSAVHVFDAQGMRVPNRWMYWNTANSRFEPATTPLPVASYCIDPRFMASNGVAATASAASLFPYVPRSVGTDPRMLRLSLYSGVNNSSGYPQAMGQLMADSKFVFDDDLTYDRPSDNSRQARQMFDDFASAAGTPSKRQTDGQFSWLATLVPKLDRYVGAPSLNYCDTYVLSVVVFHQRPGLAINGVSERVVNVSSMPGLGVTGGEVVLTAATPDALQLRSGDWLMLGGTSIFQYQDSNGNPQQRLDHDFKWYRVLDCDSEVDTGGLGYVKYATLMGRDWNLNFAVPPPNPNGSDFGTVFPQATIVEGVIGVYEKTIRLDVAQ